ncbi:unnamed protein product [Owenia fusiformis]|uniref:Uncharacterized protein n=1 Tax=Owenia fusiformis TaxID=6347 RepID=A0A8J1UJR0_OWEFU|nr:unnamed protein product [Owenia fusiformis]
MFITFIVMLFVAQAIVADSKLLKWTNMRGNSGACHHVLREVNIAGEVWLHFGRRGQNWNYIDSISYVCPINLLQQRHISAMADFDIFDYAIESDLQFRLQADDSTNPSFLKVSSVDSPCSMDVIEMGYGSDHTNLSFTPNTFDRIRCVGNNGNKCGLLNKPPRDGDTSPIFIWQVCFKPTSIPDGASASGGQWARNKFTWAGTKYVVKIKIEDSF